MITVFVHSTQPWPYPSSLMIGCLGMTTCPEGEQISFPEAELEDAKWVDFACLADSLEHHASNLTDKEPTPGNAMRVPPANAIAHQLMKAAIQLFSPNLLRRGLL